jgi:hypothetical protein
MKDNNTIYLFAVIMSLGIAGFVMFLLVATLGIPFYLVAIVFFMIIVGFFMKMARKLTHKTYEQRFQRLKECDECKAIIPENSLFCQVCGADLEEVLCEYCGHHNKPGSTTCDSCNAIIGE